MWGLFDLPLGLHSTYLQQIIPFGTSSIIHLQQGIKELIKKGT